MIALLAAATIQDANLGRRIVLQEGDSWVVEQAIRYVEEDDEVGETHREQFTYVVKSVEPEKGYRLQVSRKFLETIVQGHKVPPAPDNKPQLSTELLAFDGRLLEQADAPSDPAVRRVERLTRVPLPPKTGEWRLSYPAEPEGALPAASARFSPASRDFVSGGIMTVTVRFAEEGSRPMRADGTATIEMKSGLISSLELRLLNAPLPGEGGPTQMRLSRKLVSKKLATP